MSEDVKLEVIRITQDSLSRYIKKPPLTEKLLRKPPFRYLHDITTAVMRETGYLQGLYSQEELNPDNIKDREAKIAFLEKLISAVNLSTGVNITARPNKIVAGLDVTKTNELLQTIAKALEKKIDSAKAVEQVLNKKNKGVNQQNPSKKENIKAKTVKDVKTVESKTCEPRTSDALKKKSKDKVKGAEKPEPKKVKVKKDVSPTKSSPRKIAKAPSLDESKNVTTKDDSNSVEKLIEPPATVTETPVTTQIIGDEARRETESMLEPNPTASPLPVTADPDHHKSTEQVRAKEDVTNTQVSKPEPTTDAQPPKADRAKEDKPKPDEELKRPQSARAVHRKKPTKKPGIEGDGKSMSGKNVDNGEETVIASAKAPEAKPQQPGSSEKAAPARPRTAARPASARPGAPRVRDRGTVLLSDSDNNVVSEPVNVIVDSKELPKDDDESLVTVEAPAADIAVDQVVDESHLLAADQGHLVSQILETQKELEDTSISDPAPKVDINWGSGRHEAVTREVDKLRAAIQSLTRAANPLGKLIDFLQEDIDSMQTELETWTTTNRQLTQQLQAEERLTEDRIAPLARQLEDIEHLVEEQLEEISVAKAAIIRNDERITKLLTASTAHHPG